MTLLRMTTAATAIALGAFAGAPAGLADESVTGKVSQRFYASSNPKLRSSNVEETVGSVTRLNLSYANETPRSSFFLGTGVNFSAATGKSNDDLSGLFPDVNGKYTYGFTDAALNLRFNAAVTPVSFLASRGVVLDDSGEPIEDPDDLTFSDDSIELRFGGSVGFTQTINERSSFGVNLSARRKDFIDSSANLTPNTSVSLGSNYSRSISERTSANASASLGYFQAENDADRETYTLSLSGGFNKQVSPRLTINGQLGPSFSITRETDTVTDKRSSDERISANLNFSFDYDSSVNTSYSGGISNGVAPSSRGAAVNVAAIRLGMAHQINSYSSLNLGARLSFRTALFGAEGSTESIDDRLFLNTSVTYRYQISETVNANVGYAFRWRDTDGNKAMTHNVFMTLTKGFTLLP